MPLDEQLANRIQALNSQLHNVMLDAMASSMSMLTHAEKKDYASLTNEATVFLMSANLIEYISKEMNRLSSL